jgi:hypothetical protein
MPAALLDLQQQRYLLALRRGYVEYYKESAVSLAALKSRRMMMEGQLGTPEARPWMAVVVLARQILQPSRLMTEPTFRTAGGVG